ncbi:MAG TPA: bifunctional 3,4-dihydroxy-2-butanone-4-phosphate synthase/GTP cyclohydrolase II [Anaerohalosphaeraceae bacterium]|nr:bifunctional 3,4-dihydroxy-2-butanone-4-phosphate synthase/GTP cyclohydrolase II [Anaerohalosphaeraceae bacterium]HOL30533.1 bifunctional 3,4-dihydroxy-2-butanone-4-phosphate synthase/GTP cyclohydrolase II [Anaerohalosphaeraceae bacterium]HOM75216.1 bifunctional 3,4-dihydroxy-2-butanone-4-phosphate synthase/GTP cyclohydrolase II [Anaerohalosphaeraceae bacterium]HPC63991.1 bifunctional 3,4-dihydroxy-2-butanone-4-phosphate synthase/GTP cyclohydrolase II [Anaerohalosphaeraceae bacterium]HPO6996
MSLFSEIPEILSELKQGRMIVLVDDEDRENEGDLVCAAQLTTPEMVNFMATYGRGLICLPLSEERCDQLNLHPQTVENTARLGTAFTVSVDAREGISTGISAADRAHTIRVAADPASRPSDLVRPGHVFPLRARNGGVLVRAGQTEGAVDLMKLAGLEPAAVICEIINDDGTMARVPDLEKYCRKHSLKMTSIAKLVEYRLQREQHIHRIQEIRLPTDYGEFKMIGYSSPGTTEPHLALCKGGVGDLDEGGNPILHPEPVLIRVHSECMTGDLFHSQRCECGYQLITAMKMIQQEGKGALIYLRQEGRGIGLTNKLHAYKLQEQGLDTVDANIKLGFLPDKRDYGIGAQICRDLGLTHVRILTNNPKKISRLEVYGIKVAEQIPLMASPSEHNRDYLRTKKIRFGHLLDEDL